MTFINPKKQSEHSSDYNKENNGGVTIGSPRGATPEEKTGVKNTQTPVINKATNTSVL